MKSLGRASGGYTIIEVLIVLTVTAALFVSTALLLSGKQSKTQFEQGVHDFESQLQGAMSDVASGFYANGFKCTAIDGPNPPVIDPLTPADNGPGSNTGCVFMGKALYRVGNTNVRLIDVVGRQFKPNTGGTELATSLDTALPTFDEDAMDRALFIKYSIELRQIKNLAPSAEVLTGIAFYNDLGDSPSGAGISRQAVHLYGLRGTPATSAVGDITSVGVGNYLDLPNGVVLCLSDGGQNAEVTIGANNGDNNISSAINTPGTGACS